MDIISVERLIVEEQFEDRFADQELLDSIHENGLLTPLTVYESKDFYVVLEGHRRFDAIKRLGIEEVQVTLVPAPESAQEAKSFQVIVNRHRKDMMPTHVADAIMTLKEADVKQKEIARRFRLRESEVSTYLTLARGHKKIRDAVNAGRLTLSAAEPLLTKPMEIQEALADAAIGAKTVRKVRALIKTQAFQADVEAQQGDLDADIDPLDYLTLDEITRMDESLEMLIQQGFTSPAIAEQIILHTNKIVSNARQLERMAVSIIGGVSFEEIEENTQELATNLDRLVF
ncbi:MAG TPA: ParB/RepB/Spo0J family partition protein [bacterium]|nr:ParB/RepB/Spo0J family partition protein [bacterium]